MLEITASSLRRHFSKYINMVSDEPIGIKRGNKLAAVLLSVEQYEHFKRLEDSYSIAFAEASAASGNWVDQEKAMRLLVEMRKRSKETDDASST